MLPAPGVLALAAAFAVATALAQLASRAPPWRFDSPLQFNSDFAVATGFAWTLFQLVAHRASPQERARWLMACGAMLLLAAIQATDGLVGLGVVEDDWLIDLPLWLAVAGLTRAVLQPARRKRGVLLLWSAGLVLQTLFVVCDYGDGRAVEGWALPADAAHAVAEWAELLAIECHVVALVLCRVLPRTTVAALRNASLPLGTLARRLYGEADLFRAARYPPARWAFWPGVRGLLGVAACLGLLAAVGPAARSSSGRPLMAQLQDLLGLWCFAAFDPLSYYLQGLYRAGGRREAATYLTRLETKNGLMRALDRGGRPAPPSEDLNDKLRFAERSVAEGLAAPPILLAVDAQGIDRRVSRARLDRDLFVKPRRGRGARGTAVYRRVARERFLAPWGETLDLDALLLRLARQGRERPLIAQPRLANHAEVDDLADCSLVTVRVLTCLDALGQPVATHGLLRVLSKLEPAWHAKDEWAAAIDVQTGRLGPMVSDRLAALTLRAALHPITGARVEGRLLSTWPALRELALAAHRVFPHRALIGWDLASTPEGPRLLEGNSNPDVMFPQRAAGEGFGRSPLGPLLRHHLDVLADRLP